MHINITRSLREHLIKNFGMVHSLSDDEVRTFAEAKFHAGELDIKTIRELTTQPRVTSFSTKYITAGMRAVLTEHFKMPTSADDEQAAEFLLKCHQRGQLDLDTIRAIVKQSPDNSVFEGDKAMKAANDNRTAVDDVLDTAAKAANGGGNIRVKAPSERYSTIKSTAVHAKWDVPIPDERGQPIQTTSELEFAKAAVFLKHLAARDGVNVVLSDHERELFAEMIEKDQWCGAVGPTFYRNISGQQVKSLLNDSTSGGQELVPVAFDEVLITEPMLHSEILPMIDLRPLSRGTTVEAASLGNPTVAWGTAEGTEIALFDTADLANDVNTTIYPVSAALEVGRDLLSDSPADVGRQLVTNIGQAMLAELDKVIAIGNGTNQPEGIFTASGTTGVESDNDTSGPPTVADYERLVFAIGKQYRNRSQCAFIANDTTYSRARGIAVGASDQRRVFGMNEQSYDLFTFPFKVQNDIANTKIAFGNLKTYRLYRRQGAESQWYREGHQLARRNANLLIVRGRFGGRIVDANAWAVMADAKS